MKKFNPLQARFCVDLVISFYFWFLDIKVLGGCGVLRIRQVIIDHFFLMENLFFFAQIVEREREREMGSVMKLFFAFFKLLF